MPRSLWRNLRHSIAEPAVYATNLAQARLRRSLGKGPRPVRILLTSDEDAFTSEQQWAPLRRWSSALRNRLGVASRWLHLAKTRELQSDAFREFDVVGLKITHRATDAQAGAIASQLRERAEGSGCRLVYFDGDDDMCVQWPEVLAAVDLYVKKQVFADPKNYARRFVGKSNLTDYVARSFGTSFADNEIPESGIVRPADAAKLFLGWNIALDDKIQDLARRLLGVPLPAKDVDVMCRATVPKQNWMFPLRDGVRVRLEAMASSYRILAPSAPVPQQQYYQELQRSRICVSPFGYGELCWRDFEAILCGCLVVKPEMSHLTTRPAAFVAGVTYAPVRWDYADLEEVCARYAADEPARKRIADRALQELRTCFSSVWFVGVFEELLARLELAGSDGA